MGSVVQTLLYDPRRSTNVIPVATISVLRTSCDGHCFRPTSHIGEMHRLTQCPGGNCPGGLEAITIHV